MKIKDIIKVLQDFDPEMEPNFCVGYNLSYRVTCAKQVLKKPDGQLLLAKMTISKIRSEFDAFSGEEKVNIILEQDYYSQKHFASLELSNIIDK